MDRSARYHTCTYKSIQQQTANLYHAISTYMPATNISLKCNLHATCENYSTYSNGRSMPIYMNSGGINHVTRNTAHKHCQMTTTILQPICISRIGHWPNQPQTTLMSVKSKIGQLNHISLVKISTNLLTLYHVQHEAHLVYQM